MQALSDVKCPVEVRAAECYNHQAKFHGGGPGYPDATRSIDRSEWYGMKADYRSNGNDFTQGKVSEAILHMAIPMMIAQLINVLYSVVDRMYIGHIPGEGGLALTGIGISSPILVIIAAFSVLSGAGGASLFSIARGRGDEEQADEIMGCSLTLLLIFSVVLTAAAQIFQKPLLYLFGASETTYPYAASYTRIYTAGTVFVMLSLGMNYYINAQGFSRMGMFTVAIGAVANIILDPIFVFTLKLGIAGAAIATVISQALSAFLVMRFLLSGRALHRIQAKYLRLNKKTVGSILSLGIANFTMNVTTSLVTIACNAQLRRFGGDIYLGAMTIVGSIRDVVLMIIHGLTLGAQPVLGYNYGAGAYDRVRSGIRFTTAGVLIYAVLMWAALMLWPRPFISLFNNEAELSALTVRCIRIYFAGYCLMSLQSVGQCVFVALGRTREAIFFSLLRKVVIVVPLVYILPCFFKADGVFASEPVSDLLGGAACFITMYLTVYKKLEEAPTVRRADTSETAG